MGRPVCASARSTHRCRSPSNNPGACPMRLSALLLLVLLLALAFLDPVQAGDAMTVKETPEAVIIETDALSAQVRKKGYVSGVAAGTLGDKKTGAKDLGFGLHI